MEIETEVIGGELPRGLDELRAEARAEGFRQVDTLVAEWETGATRFDRAGEALLAARADGVLVGIGGLTVDRIVPNALRMRRFYVRPGFRRGGVGRLLVMKLLAGAQRNQPITANAAPGSVAFWESIGFRSDAHDGHTHILDRLSVATPVSSMLSR